MPHTAITVGNSLVLVAHEDFLNGYQVGHLTYMAASKRHPEPYTDEYIVGLMLEQLEDMQRSSAYGIGFALGWMTTLARKGTLRRFRKECASGERG